MMTWLFLFLLVAAAVAAGLWGYRAYVTGDASIGLNLGTWFAPRPEPRLAISEQATLDSRRKLVLVRRDDVEHLIMTGGPVDVVIETGIAVSKPEPAVGEAPAQAASPPVFTRQPRTFGQAVNE
jgi:flagellar protein FliO/FliZ